MSIKASDLIAPHGPVEPELFPGEAENENRELNIRLAAYVKQADTKVSGFTFATLAAKDEATKAWALYLAFRAAYTLALARPSEDDTQAEVLGSVTYAKDQREALKDLADSYFSDYQVLIIDSGEGLTSAASVGIPSYQTPNVFDW